MIVEVGIGISWACVFSVAKLAELDLLVVDDARIANMRRPVADGVGTLLAIVSIIVLGGENERKKKSFGVVTLCKNQIILTGSLLNPK